jgi:preprotein translocase subunit SecE
VSKWFSNHQWSRLVRFLREVRQELAGVTWPTKKELIAYTIVVLMMVIALSMSVFALDLLFSKLIVRLFGQLRGR